MKSIRLITGAIVTQYNLSHDGRRVQYQGIEYKLGLDCWWV